MRRPFAILIRVFAAAIAIGMVTVIVSGVDGFVSAFQQFMKPAVPPIIVVTKPELLRQQPTAPAETPPPKPPAQAPAAPRPVGN